MFPIRSVRLRIALWNTIAVSAAVIIALITLRQTVHWALLNEIDQVLSEDGAEVRLVVAELATDGLEAIGEELSRKAAGHKQHRWFVRLLGADNEAAWSSQSGPDDEIPQSLPLAATPSTVGNCRTLSGMLPTNSLGLTQFQIGASLDQFHDDVVVVDRLVLIIVAVMICLAPLFGFWLAGLATRRLEEMTATAASLHPSEMTERLPHRGIGDEFDQLAVTFNDLLDRLAAFLEERRNFLADAAHELRTPLAAIRSTSEVTLAEDRPEGVYRGVLEQIIEDCEALEVLVNQVLLLSEAVAFEGKSGIESVPWSDVIRKSIDMFAGVAEARDIRITCSTDSTINVLGSRRHLSQVSNNLIDNAIKYTQPGGRIDITTLRDHKSGAAVLKINDDGLGISAADLPRIFDRFFRADRARHRDSTHGTGLGLCICKSIIEAHRGTISCESELGIGSRFIVTLPISKTNQR